MPFLDLNIHYTQDHASLSNTLAFAKELGYETTALSIAVVGELPSPLPTVPIPSIAKPDQLRLLTRLTLTISDTAQNYRVAALQSSYDIIALRPTNEKALQHCCTSLECDLISIDFSQRLSYPLRFTMASSALQRGIRFEICYSPGVVAGSDARRNLISGATSLVRATRGRGIIIGSEAKSALGLRGPFDVMNLAQVWGLPQQRAKESICEETGKVVKLAGMKRTSYRGVVDIVSGGALNLSSTERKGAQGIKEVAVSGNARGNTSTSSRVGANGSTRDNGVKRKASMSSLNTAQASDVPEAVDEVPLSKNQMKKKAKKAQLEGKVMPHVIDAKADILSLRHESLMPPESL